MEILLCILLGYWIAYRFIGNRKPNPRAFWRGAWRIARWGIIPLVTIPLAFLAWYTVAAIPVSVAIILGAVIIVVGMRSPVGNLRRLMGPVARWGQPEPVPSLAAPEPQPVDYGKQFRQESDLLVDYWATRLREEEGAYPSERVR